MAPPTSIEVKRMLISSLIYYVDKCELFCTKFYEESYLNDMIFENLNSDMQ